MATTAARARQPPSPSPRPSRRDMAYSLRAASPVSPVLSPSSPSLSGYSSSESDAPRRRTGGRRPSRSPQAATSTLPIIRAHVELDPSSPEHADAPAAPSSTFKNGDAANANAVNGNGNGNGNGVGAQGQPPVLRRRRSSSVHAKPPPGVKPTKAVDWEIPRKTLHSSIGESHERGWRQVGAAKCWGPQEGPPRVTCRHGRRRAKRVRYVR